jgi:serine/threonine-protein kinase RsbW
LAQRGGRRTLELKIPSELGWERSAMGLAASVASLMGFSGERVEDVKTAVLEATLNAIEHGNRLDADKNVSIVFAPGPEQLEVIVRDRGRRAFVMPSLQPDLAAQIEGRAPRGGWGTFLIRSLVDEVEFTSTSSGHAIRMVVHRPPRAADDAAPTAG